MCLLCIYAYQLISLLYTNLFIYVGNTDGKRPLGRPSRRLEDNISTNIGEIEWEGVDWIHVAQETDHCRGPVNMVTKFLVPQETRNPLIS